jgi:hypothetical protein
MISLRLLFAFVLVIFMGLVVHADGTQSFGGEGSSGPSASDGQSGASGRDVVVTARGQSERLNLRGEDGYAPQQRGGDGSDAYSCSQPWNPDFNLQGANGGDGGNGGNGGNGGSGGDVTVYYTNVGDLAHIYADTTPGRGAQGGPAGRGGNPCVCSNRAWTLQTCQPVNDANGNPVTDPSGQPVQNCNSVQYFCQDGSRGRDGAFGNSGANGGYGTLSIIKRTQPLQAVQSSMSVTFAQALNQSVSLSENVWATRSGAASLLASGSQISDTYYEWLKRRDVNVSFVSTVPQADMAQFLNTQFTLDLSGGDVTFSEPSGVKVLTSVEKFSENQVRVTFKHIMKEENVTKLSGAFQGLGSNFNVVINDAAGVSDSLTNYVWVKIWENGIFRTKPIFEGNVPANMMTVSADKIVINAGKLGRADLIKKGNRISLRVKVLRYLQGQEYGEWWYNLDKVKLK